MRITKHGVVKNLSVLLLGLLFSWQTSAAWFEAQGQALIANSDRTAAKQRATEEAIRQALMFAGASVQSVQTLTNGLLQQDRLEVSAAGEVKDLQLVYEKWHEDYVTVRIRADIFPEPAQCAAAQFKKTLVTTYFPLAHRQQAQDGQIHQLTDIAPRQLQQQMNTLSEHVALTSIEPYTVRWDRAKVLSQAPSLARQTRSQFILAAVITDISLARTAHSTLAFWKNDEAFRQYAMDVYVVDGMNGALLLDNNYHTQAQWDFDRFAQVDVSSEQFWSSEYGKAVNRLYTQVVDDVEQALLCQPATGRVLTVNGSQLQVSIGRAHGIRPGDELTLYKTSEVIDPQGMTFLQYNLYPSKVKVISASVDSATVEVADASLVGNIQPNDFVAKR